MPFEWPLCLKGAVQMPHLTGYVWIRASVHISTGICAALKGELCILLSLHFEVLVSVFSPV